MAQTKENQRDLTPQGIKQLLIEGNKRFVEGKMLQRDLKQEMLATIGGQYPHTAILGCVDSRATSEQIFDQGIGDIFNTRIAGGVINDDVLGSLEFACKLAGSKLILVLGHTHCGAVTAATEGVKIGHFSNLLDKIHPSIEKARQKFEDIKSREAIQEAVKENVLNSVREIREKSDILRKMEDNNEINITGGIYNIETGKVEFLVNS